MSSELHKKQKFLPTRKMENPSSFVLTQNEKTALIGYGREHAKIQQIDLSNDLSTQVYHLPGKNVYCIEPISNNTIVAGTDTGYIVLIDLANKIVINKTQLSSKKATIKNIKYDHLNDILYAITKDLLFAIETNNLTVLFQHSLSLEPWDITLIPNSKLLAISGKKNQLDIIQSKNSYFICVDSKSYDPPNKDICAIVYNTKFEQLISGSESGYLDFWQVSTKGLVNLQQQNINDRIYHLVSLGEYVAFSTSKSGAFIYNLNTNQLNNIANAAAESEILLKQVDNNILLIFQTGNNTIRFLNLNTSVTQYQNITNLSEYPIKISLTNNAELIAITRKGIHISSLTNQTTQNDPKFVQIKDFMINHNGQSALLINNQNKFQHIHFIQNKQVSINLPIKINSWQIEDFVDDLLLFSASNIIALFNITTLTKTLERSYDSTIKQARIIDHNHIAVLTYDDIDASPSIEAQISVFNHQTLKLNNQGLGFNSHSLFICNNKLVISDRDHPSTIMNLLTNTKQTFDIGYCIFSQEDIVFNTDCSLCLYQSFNKIFCADINNSGKKVWMVEDA